MTILCLCEASPSLTPYHCHCLNGGCQHHDGYSGALVLSYADSIRFKATCSLLAQYYPSSNLIPLKFPTTRSPPARICLCSQSRFDCILARTRRRPLEHSQLHTRFIVRVRFRRRRFTANKRQVIPVIPIIPHSLLLLCSPTTPMLIVSFPVFRLHVREMSLVAVCTILRLVVGALFGGGIFCFAFP